MSNSFLHSWRIILYNILLAIFRHNKWSLCLLRWWHDLGDDVAEATPCRRRLMAAIISPFPFPSLLLVLQMSSFPMSPERLPGCSFILPPLEPLQCNDIIWPCQIWWNLFLSKCILVHVEGQESSGWINSLWLIIRFPLVLTLGNPFLTVFFATMQHCVGGWSESDVANGWCLTPEKRIDRAELGITRWIETMAQWGCVLAGVASRDHGRWQTDTQGGQDPANQWLGTKLN